MKKTVPEAVIAFILLFLSWNLSGKEEVYTVIADAALVRSNVEGKYSYIADLRRDDTVIFVRMYDKTWAEIKLGDQVGYIMRVAIAPKKTEPAAKETGKGKNLLAEGWGRFGNWIDNIGRGDVFRTIGKWIRALIVIALLFLAYLFREELAALLVPLAFMGGVGSLVGGIFFHQWGIGAVVGVIIWAFVFLRSIGLKNISGTVRTLMGMGYYVISFPFYVLNQIQYFLSEPWRYLFKEEHFSEKTKGVLRVVFEVLQVLLYIGLTPLRLVNAIYYNILIHCITEIYDLTLEVFVPNKEKEGAGDTFKWIALLPWRVLRYPVFHGILVIVESVIWTLIDIFVPAITLYHGTDLTAGRSIVGNRRRNERLGWDSGTFKASSSSWAGIGVYFAAKRRVASAYANDPYRLSDRDPVVITCRVSTGRIINYSLAPYTVYYAAGQNGSPSTINKYAEKAHYTTGEWWNGRGRYWEYCLFDWKNLYNARWRIRPLYVFNYRTLMAQHVPGGMAHWIFKF